jgi:hypothetical protein
MQNKTKNALAVTWTDPRFHSGGCVTLELCKMESSLSGFRVLRFASVTSLYAPGAEVSCKLVF